MTEDANEKVYLAIAQFVTIALHEAESAGLYPPDTDGKPAKAPSYAGKRLERAIDSLFPVEDFLLLVTVLSVYAKQEDAVDIGELFEFFRQQVLYVAAMREVCRGNATPVLSENGGIAIRAATDDERKYNVVLTRMVKSLAAAWMTRRNPPVPFRG